MIEFLVCFEKHNALKLFPVASGVNRHNLLIEDGSRLSHKATSFIGSHIFGDVYLEWIFIGCEGKHCIFQAHSVSIIVNYFFRSFCSLVICVI